MVKEGKGGRKVEREACNNNIPNSCEKKKADQNSVAFSDTVEEKGRVIIL